MAAGIKAGTEGTREQEIEESEPTKEKGHAKSACPSCSSEIQLHGLLRDFLFFFYAVAAEKNGQALREG